MKKRIPLIVAVLLCFFSLTACGLRGAEEEEPSSAGQTPSSFTEHRFTTPTTTIGYWLYTPENAEEGLPLLLYLHSASSKGSDLELLCQDGFPKYVKDGELKLPKAFAVMPQLTADKRGWTEIAEEIRALTAFLCREYGIDGDRISLTGHSMGGTGTWSLALRFPELFSCIAPLSGGIKYSQENLDLLRDLPIRAFVGSADTIVDPLSSQQFIAELEKTNPKAQITVFDGATHFDVPALAYLGNSGLTEWLVSQTRQPA